jgi:preprotein translocase subunit SecD
MSSRGADVRVRHRPGRGFAVVLMIGIVTSVFTAVTMTRMWVAQWLRRARPSD